MKKISAFLFAFCLCAADSWESKPFTDWSEKELQKILTNSPWSHNISVSMGEPLTGGGRGDRLGADEGPPRPGGDLASAMGPSDGGGSPRNDAGGRGGIQAPPSLALTVRWQSALPIKQALVRRKYGSEAATSPEAKKFLDENSVYLIAVSGIPATVGRAPQAKTAIQEQSTLSVKGKAAVQATDIVLGPLGKQVDAFFVFPKTTPFTLDDKEVEFSTRLGPVTVKYKFRLKDMLYNGTLEL
jgi:hypothetical protein